MEPSVLTLVRAASTTRLDLQPVGRAGLAGARIQACSSERRTTSMRVNNVGRPELDGHGSDIALEQTSHRPPSNVLRTKTLEAHGTKTGAVDRRVGLEGARDNLKQCFVSAIPPSVPEPDRLSVARS
jgi:hypothetical protein